MTMRKPVNQSPTEHLHTALPNEEARVVACPEVTTPSVRRTLSGPLSPGGTRTTGMTPWMAPRMSPTLSTADRSALPAVARATGAPTYYVSHHEHGGRHQQNARLE